MFISIHTVIPLQYCYILDTTFSHDIFLSSSSSAVTTASAVNAELTNSSHPTQFIVLLTLC